MVASYSNFPEVIGARLQQFSPEAIRDRHIAIARQGLTRHLAVIGGKPVVSIQVDGHPAASETEVRPFGTIVYLIRRGVLADAARFAKAIAREISPVVTGQYREGWTIIVDGVELEDEDEIQPGATEIIVVNGVPYARKIEIFGARLVGTPPGIVERVIEHVLQRFGQQIVATLDYVRLEGGYVLKRPPGGEMTYPAVVLRNRR